MPVSQPALSSSIDLSGLPGRVAEALAELVAVCRALPASVPCAFEEAELRVRESVNALGCEVLGAWVEGLDDGALRVEWDDQSWFRVPATTIMTTLGPVTYKRARYRHGAHQTSLVPVDESLGLVNDFLTRPAARLGLMMMGYSTAREAEAFFSEMGAMTPSASTLQQLACSLHERWEGLGPQAMDAVRDTDDIPPEAVSASVSLDGVMVALRAGEDGRDQACWREAACGTVAFHDRDGERLRTLYFARMPESGKLALKAQLASEVAHIRQARPDIAITAVADGAPDNWTFLERLSAEAETIDFWHACEHLRTASDHAVDPHWFETYRHVLRHDPQGVVKVIRALRYLRDKAAGRNHTIERELAFFRKHRKRMRYRNISDRSLAIGSGVVEAACKTLVTQRLKRSGMRWGLQGGQAVLTVRALIKSGRFDRAWDTLMACHANDNRQPETSDSRAA